MAESKPLPTPSEDYNKKDQDILINSLEDFLYQLSNEIDSVSFGKNTSISLYSKRELMILPKLGIESIT